MVLKSYIKNINTYSETYLEDYSSNKILLQFDLLDEVKEGDYNKYKKNKEDFYTLEGTVVSPDIMLNQGVELSQTLESTGFTSIIGRIPSVMQRLFKNRYEDVQSYHSPQSLVFSLPIVCVFNSYEDYKNTVHLLNFFTEATFRYLIFVGSSLHDISDYGGLFDNLKYSYKKETFDFGVLKEDGFKETLKNINKKINKDDTYNKASIFKKLDDKLIGFQLGKNLNAKRVFYATAISKRIPLIRKKEGGIRKSGKGANTYPPYMAFDITLQPYRMMSAEEVNKWWK